MLFGSRRMCFFKHTGQGAERGRKGGLEHVRHAGHDPFQLVGALHEGGTHACVKECVCICGRTVGLIDGETHRKKEGGMCVCICRCCAPTDSSAPPPFQSQATPHLSTYLPTPPTLPYSPTLVVDKVDGAAQVEVDEVHLHVLLHQQLCAAGEHVGVRAGELWVFVGERARRVGSE